MLETLIGPNFGSIFDFKTKWINCGQQKRSPEMKIISGELCR
jgi:hypothetical protein